jgi:hypothetical protein
MPRIDDAGGGDTNYFDFTSALVAQNQLLEAGKLDPILSSATALQMFREGINRTPRDTAKALFDRGVRGSFLREAPRVFDKTQLQKELIEYTQKEVDQISSQVIFNVTNTADMVANPLFYRAYARSLQDNTLVLAGTRRQQGGAIITLPPLPILPFTNANNPAAATSATYNQGTRTTNLLAPNIMVQTRVGVLPTNQTPDGIGFNMFFNPTFVLPKLWNITIYYYNPAGGALQTYPIAINSVPQYGSVSSGGVEIIKTIQRPASDTAGYLNVQVFWTLYGAMAVQPTGFAPVPVGVPTFDATSFAANPRIVWDCA